MLDNYKNDFIIEKYIFIKDKKLFEFQNLSYIDLLILINKNYLKKNF